MVSKKSVRPKRTEGRSVVAFNCGQYFVSQCDALSKGHMELCAPRSAMIATPHQPKKPYVRFAFIAAIAVL
jgi:hypothetical protein